MAPAWRAPDRPGKKSQGGKSRLYWRRRCRTCIIQVVQHCYVSECFSAPVPEAWTRLDQVCLAPSPGRLINRRRVTNEVKCINNNASGTSLSGCLFEPRRAPAEAFITHTSALHVCTAPLHHQRWLCDNLFCHASLLPGPGDLDPVTSLLRRVCAHSGLSQRAQDYEALFLFARYRDSFHPPRPCCNPTCTQPPCCPSRHTQGFLPPPNQHNKSRPAVSTGPGLTLNQTCAREPEARRRALTAATRRS